MATIRFCCSFVRERTNLNSPMPKYKCIFILSYLYAEVSSIDVIAEEEILGIGRRPAHFKQFHQIVKLSMDVATNCPIFSIHFQNWSPDSVHWRKKRHKFIYRKSYQLQIDPCRIVLFVIANARWLSPVTKASQFPAFTRHAHIYT